MYHGGNLTLLGDAEERTPVCDPSHPNYCYLGTFFIWVSYLYRFNDSGLMGLKV